MRLSKKTVLLIAILFAVLSRVYFFPSPLNENLPDGTGQGDYLHYISMFSTHSIGEWDFSWPGGLPFLTFYPPLSFYLSGLLSGLLGVIISFKTVFMLFFALTPVAFYMLLQEFNLNIKEKTIALLIFSFTFYFNAIIAVGMQFAFIVALFFSILFLKYFIKLVRTENKTALLLASLFLGLTMLSHTIITLLFGILSLFYLFSALYLKFNAQKIKLALASYVLSIPVAIAWLVPYLVEHQHGFLFETSAYPLSFIPFISLPLLYGYYVNFFTVIIACLSGFLLLYGLKNELGKRNVESVFLLSSIIGTFILYFIIYWMFPLYFPIKADRFITIWTIPFSILFARCINKKTVSYLVYIFLITQIVLFLGTNLATYNHASYYEETMSYLQGKDGRVTFQPQDGGIDLFTFYLAPEYGLSLTMGDVGQSLSPKRTELIGTASENTLFDCAERRSLWNQLFSLDILSRKSLAYPGECRLVKDYHQIFDLQDTHYIAADKRFPSVVTAFLNDSSLQLIQETDHFMIFRYDKPVYVNTDSNVSYSVSKTKDRIEITLRSNETKSALYVRLSEGWYPHWTSRDVDIVPDEQEYLTFTVPELSGEKKIVLEYNRPSYFLYAEIFSIISVLLILVALLYSRYINKNH